MPDSTDLQVLTQSIGMTCVQYIGRESLVGLGVEFDPRSLEADVQIALKDNSEDSQRVALKAFFEVEEIFADEVVLVHHFVNEIRSESRAKADARRQFSFA